MKKLNIILSAILLVMFVGCEDSKHLNDDLIHIDLSKSYPKKELILQDFMDVEYIPLETTDDFLTQGIVKAVGKEYLVVTNRFNDGDIFIFHRRTGKGIRKINRQGQGGEEYIIQMKSSAANYSFRVNASLGHAGAVKEDIKYVLPLKNGLLDSNPIVVKLKLKSG